MRNSVRLLFWFCTVEPSSLNEATASCPSQDLSSFLKNPRVEEIFHPLLGEGSPDDLGGKPLRSRPSAAFFQAVESRRENC